MTLQKEHDALIAYDKEMKQINTFIKIKKDHILDDELKIKKSEHEQSRLEKDWTTAVENLKQIEMEHEWIKPLKA
jgi:uncharacterized protein (DUF3084 family)